MYRILCPYERDFGPGLQFDIRRDPGKFWASENTLGHLRNLVIKVQS